MDKDSLEKLKKDIELKFGELSKQAEQMQVELVKLQGEYRIVSKILSDISEKKD